MTDLTHSSWTQREQPVQPTQPTLQMQPMEPTRPTLQMQPMQSIEPMQPTQPMHAAECATAARVVAHPMPRRRCQQELIVCDGAFVGSCVWPLSRPMPPAPMPPPPQLPSWQQQPQAAASWMPFPMERSLSRNRASPLTPSPSPTAAPRFVRADVVAHRQAPAMQRYFKMPPSTAQPPAQQSPLRSGMCHFQHSQVVLAQSMPTMRMLHCVPMALPVSPPPPPAPMQSWTPVRSQVVARAVPIA